MNRVKSDYHSRDPIRSSYDPLQWLQRAKVQAMLGRTELAAGDCWKAAKLCRLIVSSQALQQGWHLGYGCGFWMKVDSSDDDENDTASSSIRASEASSIIRTKMLEIEDEAVQLQSQFTGGETPGMGQYVPEEYPWLDTCHRIRSDRVLEQVNEEFVSAGRRLGKLSCIAARHALETNSADAFGVFAAQDIKAGELILVDESEIWGCNIPRSLLKTTAQPSTLSWLGLPKDEADQILHLVSRSQSGDAARTMLKVRCLRNIVLDGVRHPLDHPVLARLKPTYHRHQSTDFHLSDDITIPNEALIMFGVDIFAEDAFDTWVLFEVEARIDNNCFTSPTSACLGGLFALFNHSCSPNVRWSSSQSHRSVSLYAERDIDQGEQLFVAYNTYAIDLPLEMRQAELSRWIDGGCKCPRCKDEARNAGDADPCMVPDGGGGWDCFAKPILPENTLRDAG